MSQMGLLSRSEVFGSLTVQQVSRIEELCRDVTYTPGAMIFMEGDEAREFYVVDSGRVALELGVRPVANHPAITTALEIVTEGECFGWSALVEPHRYTTSARCLNHCSLLAIRGDALKGAMDSDPELGYRLMEKVAQIISQRLMHARQRLLSGHGLAVFPKSSGQAGSG